MSVLEELRAVEQRIVARLLELEPAMVEYRELQQVAAQLGIERPLDHELTPSNGNGGPASDQSTRQPPASETKTTTRGTRRTASVATPHDTQAPAGGTRAIGADRRARALAMIGDRPGITVPELSDALGVGPSPMYRIIRRLQASGEVVKRGKGLKLR